MDITQATAHELLKELRQGSVSCDAVYKAFSERAQKADPRINAFVRRSGPLETASPGTGQGSGPLRGLPIALKDNICTRGVRTECCSRILKGFVPPYDATVVERLKDAGATLVSTKLNMDEFAFGSSTEHSLFGPTRNPWDTSRVPGGSSGGCAAAVSAGEALWALGSDTGGSIRQPAAFCGIVGMKPTYGRVSRYGLIAFASSLDQIGPLTRDVEDCALLLSVISGFDPKDSTCADVAVPDYCSALGRNLKGLRVGIPAEYFVSGIDAQVKRLVEEAIRQIEKLGAEIVSVSLPHTRYAVPVYYIIATAEASSNLARYDGVQYGARSAGPSIIDMYTRTRAEGFGEEAKRRILLGTFALSHGYYDAYYLRALKVRSLIQRDFERAFGACDCLVTPTAPTAAFGIGEKAQEPLQMYLSDIFTISGNLAGIPALSVPCGFTAERLPVGLQVMGKAFDEETLLRVAHAYEQSTPWHKERPPC